MIALLATIIGAEIAHQTSGGSQARGRPSDRIQASSYLALLRRPRHAASDTIPSVYLSQLAHTALSTRAGAQLAQSRRAWASDPATWVVPTGSGACVLVAWRTPTHLRPAIACGPRSVLESQGLLSVTDADGRAYIGGVVPNGVKRVTTTANGHQASIPVRENVYTAVIRQPTSLSFTRNGKREGLGRIRPVPRARHCTHTGADVICTRAS
jgi:hypothetical protein